jgi:L-aminopeptidase/D-esterase-like protein
VNAHTETSAPRLAPDRPSTGQSNQNTSLTPARGSGSGVVEYDFPGVLVGTAQYDEGPTGATVIAVPAGARTAVDARGGAVGLSGGFPVNHAICLAGGSVHGLEAGAGVMTEMRERRGNSTLFSDLPLVSTAIIYDYPARGNAIHPDAALGRAAYRNAESGWAAYGRVGAGCSATVGKVHSSRREFAGQGVAFRQVGDVKILVVTVVNAVGVVVDRDGTVVRGNFDSRSGERRHPHLDYATSLASGVAPDMPRGNTTITAVVTNVDLSDADLSQFARQVHGSMNRGIQPFHTSMDGDVLFALTTAELGLPDAAARPGLPSATATAIGGVAAEVVWDAILQAAS